MKSALPQGNEQIKESLGNENDSFANTSPKEQHISPSELGDI